MAVEEKEEAKRDVSTLEAVGKPPAVLGRTVVATARRGTALRGLSSGAVASKTFQKLVSATFERVTKSDIRGGVRLSRAA